MDRGPDNGSQDDRKYRGRVLDQGFSGGLKNRVNRLIRSFQAFEETGCPALPYVSAWQGPDEDIWFEYASPRFLRLLRVSQEALADTLRQNITDYREYHVDDNEGVILRRQGGAELESVRAMLRRRAQQSGVFEAVYKIELPDKSSLWLKDQALVEAYPQDRVYLSIGSITPVSGEMETRVARIHQEKALSRTKRLEALGLLAGGIAHDFNNLLFMILGNVDVARMACPEGSPEQRSLEAALEAVGRARVLTDKFITFSDGGLSRTRPTLISSLIHAAQSEALEGAMGRALTGARLTFETRIAENLPKVMADTGQMAQALSNILQNALEAMPNGGRLQVTADPLNVSPDNVASPWPLAPGQYVKISVSDQGPGIHEDELDRIFDPYFSTKERGSQKGMGLGLTIADSIVHRHGGTVQVESSLGRGTNVHIVLPANPTPEAA